MATTHTSLARSALSTLSSSLRWSAPRRSFSAARSLYQQPPSSSPAPTSTPPTSKPRTPTASSSSSQQLPPSMAELMGQQPPVPSQFTDLLSNLHSTFSAHITPTTQNPTSASDWWTSRSPLNSHTPLGTPGTPQSGRSVPVRSGDVAQAYRALSGRLARNKIKKELREGEFYEKPSDKKRRLEMERHRRRFQVLVRQKVRLVQAIRSRK